MSEAQAEWAIQTLYESMDARDELTDEEAETLLKWGEAQVMRLAGQEMDDEAFHAAFEQLSTMLRGMNRLAARRESMPLADEQAALSRISAAAASIGLTLPARTVMRFEQQTAKSDIHANVRELIAMLSSQAETEAQPVESLPDPDPPPESHWTSAQDYITDSTEEDWDA